MLCSLNINLTFPLFSVAHPNMEAGLTVLPENINPSTFPAKLWRLVNNPASTAICWDHLGKAIVINQERFESQILSSTSSPNLDNTGSFKTTNFCSFVRQLNLYGFKKISPVAGGTLSSNSGTYHCFFHKNFNRNHPELVADLRRLTADNKAKLSAGLKVSHRPWSSRRGSGEEKDSGVKKSSVSPQSPMTPNCLDTAPTKTAHAATPVYPLYLMTSHVEGIVLTDQPVTLNQYTTRILPCSNVILIKQTLPVGLTQQSPNLTSDYTGPGLNQPGLNQPGLNQPGLYSPCEYDTCVLKSIWST